MRGAVSKQAVIDKILETFQGSFVYGKELRIPMVEDGEQVEIKVTLACAKTNVGNGAVAGDFESGNAVQVSVTEAPAKPTQAEIDNISKLMNRLGL